MKNVAFVVVICMLLITCSEMEMKWEAPVEMAGPGAHHVNDIVSFGKKGIGITGCYEEEPEKPQCITAWYDEKGNLKWYRVFERPQYKTTSGKTVKFTWIFKELIEKESNLYVHIQAIDFKDHQNSVLVKYDTIGNIAWEKIIAKPDEVTELQSTMLLDYTNNLYIAGLWGREGSVQSIFITKFNESGDEEWAAHYDHPDLNTPEVSFDVKDEDNVIIGGVMRSSRDFFYLRYDRSGELKQVKIIRTPEQAIRLADIQVDTEGSVYMLGTSRGSGGDDFSTVVCSPSDSVLWIKSFDGPAHRDDIPVSIVYLSTLDTLSVYVTGQSENDHGTSDAVTVKYDRTGAEVWTRRFVGRAGESVVPIGIQAGKSEYGSHMIHSLYVTGYVKDDALILQYNSSGFFTWFTRYGRRDEICRPTASGGMLWAIGCRSKSDYSTYLLEYGKVEYLGFARWD